MAYIKPFDGRNYKKYLGSNDYMLLRPQKCSLESTRMVMFEIEVAARLTITL